MENVTSQVDIASSGRDGMNRLATWRVAAGLALAAAALLTAQDSRAQRGPAYRTQNVVILAIDGVRSSEAFRNSRQSPPGSAPYFHPLLPRIWSELVPNGTTYTNAKNIETTYTTPGFNCILSGNWQMGPNRSRQDLNAFFENRSRTPLLTEILRKSTGQEALVVVGKRNSLTNDYSIHPAFGPAFGPRFIFIDSGRRLEDAYFDNRVWTRAVSEMQARHPRLAFINLGATDLAGHQADFPLYLQIIRNWDQLVVDFWQFIQTDPVYRDTTTLILTTDHGRHLEETIDYVSHGGSCDGCRDLMLFVIGPDTPRGARVNRRVRQSDIAPTIAELLGLPLAQTDGEPLAEALGRPYVVNDLGSREVSTASNGSLVFLASAERLGPATDIRVRGSRDGGLTFGPSVTLSDLGPGAYDATAKHPRLAVVGDRLHALWVDLKEPSGLWSLRHRSADFAAFAAGGDLRFGSETLLESSIVEGQRSGNSTLDGGMIITRPSLAALPSGGSYKAVAAFSMNRSLMGIRATPTDFVNEPPNVKRRAMLPFTRYFPEEPSVAAGGPDEVFLAWIDLNVGIQTDINEDGIPEDVHPWNLVFNRSVDGGMTWSDPPVVLTSGLASVSHPRVAFDPASRSISVVYASADSSGRTQIRTMVGKIERRWTRSDAGVSFKEPVSLTSSATGAWEPAIALDRAGGLHIAYVDHDFAGGDVFLGYTQDRKRFETVPLNVSSSAGSSVGPSIEIVTDGAGAANRVVVWRETDAASSALRPATAVVPFTMPAR